MKGREVCIAAGANSPGARALSGITPAGERRTALESNLQASPSETPRRRVALVIARPDDETLLASSPVLHQALPHFFRDTSTLADVLESCPLDACVIDGELPLVSRSLLAHVAARVPTLVILGAEPLALLDAMGSACIDFVRRPLDHTEVDVRLSRLLRQRFTRADAPAPLRCGSLEIDLLTGENSHDFRPLGLGWVREEKKAKALIAVRVRGAVIKLRRLELKVLVYLLQNERRWIAVEEIQRHVLGTSGGGGSVRTHIWEIRSKLTRSGAPGIIQSERGKGYRAVAL